MIDLYPSHPEGRPDLSCTGTLHVYDGWGSEPWCRCGGKRNQAFRRSLLQRLTRRPRSPRA